LGSSTCWRANASNRFINSAPRMAAFKAVSACRNKRGVCCSERVNNCMLPTITESRLLKSCAMPPVSRPTASIF
jgi:hypothetical protein